MIVADLSGSWKSSFPGVGGFCMGRDVVSQSLELTGWKRNIQCALQCGHREGWGFCSKLEPFVVLGGWRCWSPPCWGGTLLMALLKHILLFGVCCSRHSSPRVQGKEHLLLLKSLILKAGYKAEAGSNQLKLHFHSALHAKPLKALKKILEAEQHKIALAHCSRKTNLLPGFKNWKFTRLIAELPGPGMELEKGPCEIRAV